MTCIDDFNSADVSGSFRALAALGLSSRPVIAALSERAIEIAPKSAAIDLAFIVSAVSSFKSCSSRRLEAFSRAFSS
jgi:hypothetical protein